MKAKGRELAGGSYRETPARSWLMSFNDLLTLILTFFVLMISMSSISAHPLREASQSLMKALGLVVSKEPLLIRSFDPFVTPFMDQDIDREKQMQKAQDQMDRSQLTAGLDGRRDMVRYFNALAGIHARVIGEGVAITLNEGGIFETGSERIKREALPLLQGIGHRLKDVDGRIAVEVHTDDRPVGNPRFASNWEFSTARAVSAVNYLVSEGSIPPENISAIGYAGLKPLVANDSPGNRARNRRLDILWINRQK